MTASKLFWHVAAVLTGVISWHFAEELYKRRVFAVLWIAARIIFWDYVLRVTDSVNRWVIRRLQNTLNDSEKTIN